ncbi:MAG: 1-acyl-sn-glycerol-3-phosphate acyltransferase [Lachnospiraceae bacterium]|nr:1-acyl-sn-glycerol-3-phosphate acyltransferase [Lachnospiraceae bacterium]
MIRFILSILFMLLFFLTSVFMWAYIWIVERFSKKKADLITLHIVQGVLKTLQFLCGVKLTVIGEENVPKDEAVLYIGNHKSDYDTIFTYARCPGLTGYIAKDSLEKVPFMRVWMRKAYCLFLNRDNPREGLKTILKAIEYVKQGVSITIFPEGGRNKTDAPTLPFHEGSFKVATKTGCKIVPMAITNSENVFETHIPFLRPAHVVLQYGKPIDIVELSPEEKKFIGAYTQKIIENMLIDNQNYL